jgi:hypothetical protein
LFRFVGLGTLPMQAPELAVQEMKRAVGRYFKEKTTFGCFIASEEQKWLARFYVGKVKNYV